MISCQEDCSLLIQTTRPLLIFNPKIKIALHNIVVVSEQFHSAICDVCLGPFACPQVHALWQSAVKAN